MSNNQEESNEVERMKTALYDSIVKIVEEETLKLDAIATPQFINALLDLTWTQLESTITDVEAFARHAGRSTITPADVLMLSRRNEGLEETLKAYQEHLESMREDAS